MAASVVLPIHPEEQLLRSGRSDGAAAALMMDALSVNDVTKLNELLKTASPNTAVGPLRRCPLAVACALGSLPAVRMLLDAGSDPNAEDHRSRTPLHEACAAGEEAIVGLLLAAGANVDCADDLGFTPLHEAASNLHAPVLRRLVNFGAATALRSVTGHTARDLAGWQLSDPRGKDIQKLLDTHAESQGRCRADSERHALRPRLVARGAAGGDSLTLAWSGDPGALEGKENKGKHDHASPAAVYDLSFRVVPGQWRTAAMTQSSCVTVKGLQPDAEYQFRARQRLGGGKSEWGEWGYLSHVMAISK